MNDPNKPAPSYSTSSRDLLASSGHMMPKSFISGGQKLKDETKKNLLATHSHISWPSASSQCGRQGCRPETRGRRQTLLADSRPEGAPL